MGIEGLNVVEEKLALARETIGPNAELMLNAVMSYNVEFAVQIAERLRPCRMRWLEEPLIPTDLEGHVELKKSVPWMPIANRRRPPWTTCVSTTCRAPVRRRATTRPEVVRWTF